ncbi:hypothetical protein CL616_03580 [archaeon]|nr:hypothetical protein [archaeon]|tara:strand:- start:64 stop:519 length:456 start_codon:yes stop_codon:yes gene_type:complete
MQKLKALNSRELKELYKELERFGFNGKLDCIVLLSSKDKLYLLSRDYEKLDVSSLRINNKGMYFGKKEKDGLRLSIEGSQIINATKNVVELDKEGMEKWVSGSDVDFNHDTGYVIVKYGKDVLGCGRIVDNKLRNMVPKERRIKELVSARI